MELDNCECKQWARVNQKFLTNHHPHCSKYDPEGDACSIIDKLLQVMRQWGSEEDGIIDFACDAYDMAAISILQSPLPPNPDDKSHAPFLYEQQKNKHDKYFEEFELLELPDPDSLETLADWVDLQYPDDKNPEVQIDLRLWAYNLRKIESEVIIRKNS